MQVRGDSARVMPRRSEASRLSETRTRPRCNESPSLSGLRMTRCWRWRLRRRPTHRTGSRCRRRPAPAPPIDSGGNASSSALLTAPYDPARRQTGQSEPYITRSGPKMSTTRATYGLRSAGRPVGPVGLGDHARELAGDVRQGAERLHQRRPGVDLARGDRRFGEVVDDEAHVGKRLRRRQRRRQLARADQDVVGQTGVTHRGQPALHVRTQQPFRHPPHHGPGAGCRRASVRSVAIAARPASRRRSGSVRSTQPTTPATKRVRCGDLHELPRLLDAGHGLHQHGVVDARRGQQRPQISRAERAADGVELGAGHPVVVVPRRRPEMVVGIDDRRARVSSVPPQSRCGAELHDSGSSLEI